MPFLKAKEIREMSSERRNERLSELRVELTRLRAMSKAGGYIENPSRIRQIRRAIARILTVENEEKAKG
jgi:large subunit ribosomal protein L29